MSATTTDYLSPREQDSIIMLTTIKLSARVRLLRYQQAIRTLEFSLKVMSAGQAEISLDTSGAPIDQTLTRASKPVEMTLVGLRNAVERAQYQIADSNRKIAELQRKAHIRAGRDEESFDQIDHDIKEFVASFED